MKYYFFVLLILFLVSCSFSDNNTSGNILYVPSQYSSIQKAIDTAENGDIIVIENGTYQENLKVKNKTITITSQYYFSHDKQDIENTIINGEGRSIFSIAENTDNISIIGLSIINGNDGISSFSVINIIDNIIRGNIDGIDYEGGGGLCRNNIITNNTDDAIDLDDATSVTIENNILSFNSDDGIEIRFHPYNGKTLEINILNNIIESNGEDGIQFIGYDTLTDRKIKIEKNLIINTSMSAIGLMDGANTIEDYRGARLEEEIIITNNTFVNNNYTVTGGANILMVNNIITETREIALKNIRGVSLVDNNLYWNNIIDTENVNMGNTQIMENPLLTSDYFLKKDSPAIDQGRENIVWKDKTIIISDLYNGISPDLGFREYE